MHKPPDTRSERELKLYLDAAEEAARAAGTIVMENLDRRLKVDYKGRIDLVTDADRASQECILDMLFRHFPNHEFLAEESERHDIGDGHYLWVIDPLDGTTNYAHGYRCFAISIALLIDRESTIGLVYDPWGDEMFTATRGHGAFVNGGQISVSDESDLEKSLLVTGFPYDIREGNITNLGLFNHLILRAQAIRRDGSAALDLAYVAAGRFDGFWELKLFPWDVAAGTLIVEEAGGTVSTFTGEPAALDSFDLLVTNGRIHEVLVQAISEIPRDSW